MAPWSSRPSLGWAPKSATLMTAMSWRCSSASKLARPSAAAWSAFFVLRFVPRLRLLLFVFVVFAFILHTPCESGGPPAAGERFSACARREHFLARRFDGGEHLTAR